MKKAKKKTEYIKTAEPAEESKEAGKMRKRRIRKLVEKY